MNLQLRQLIDAFRTAQDRAIDLLFVSLRIPLPRNGPDWVLTGHAAVREAARSLDSGITLDPHGYGIEVVHPDFRVDFDFGPDGQVDCFDVWRLALHRHYLTDATPPVGPYPDIKDWVAAAVREAELIVVPGNSESTFQDPTLLRPVASIPRAG